MTLDKSRHVYMYVSTQAPRSFRYRLERVSIDVKDFTSGELTLLGRILSGRLAKLNHIQKALDNESMLMGIQMSMADMLAVLPMLRPEFLSVGLRRQTIEERWLDTARAMARAIARLGHTFSAVFSDHVQFLSFAMHKGDMNFDVLACDAAESVATKLAYYALHLHWTRLLVQSEAPHLEIPPSDTLLRVPAWASMSVFPMPQPTEIVNAVTAYVDWTRPASERVQLQSPSMPSCSRPTWKVELTGLPWLCANGACIAFAPLKCAGCKDMPRVAYYCSKKCQTYDWRNRHKNECST